MKYFILSLSLCNYCLSDNFHILNFFKGFGIAQSARNCFTCSFCSATDKNKSECALNSDTCRVCFSLNFFVGKLFITEKFLASFYSNSLDKKFYLIISYLIV